MERRGPPRERPRQRGRVPRDARLAARHPDRRRRARRGLLPGDRAGQGPARRRRRSTHEESEWLLREFLSAELFRRGLICRADDRGDPVDPALAAADRRPGAVRGDRGGPAPGARGGRPAGASRRRPRRRARRCATLTPRPRRSELVAGEDGLDAPVRWVHISELRRPDAMAVGRRAAADDGDEARPTRPSSARTSSALADHGLAGLGLGVGFAHAEVPDGAARGRRRARLPAASRSRTSCRSSRSPRRRSRGWSTSSTRCSSARSPRTSGWSASCSPSAAWTAIAARARRR